MFHPQHDAADSCILGGKVNGCGFYRCLQGPGKSCSTGDFTYKPSGFGFMLNEEAFMNDIAVKICVSKHIHHDCALLCSPSINYFHHSTGNEAQLKGNECGSSLVCGELHYIGIVITLSSKYFRV
jgi:hypothetical protein